MEALADQHWRGLATGAKHLMDGHVRLAQRQAEWSENPLHNLIENRPDWRQRKG